MSAPKLKIGVIGVGKMGTLHLEKYLTLSNVEVVGIYDNDPMRAEAIERKYGLKHFSDLRDLLFEADGVTIASPTSTHYRICREAFQAGVNVLLEKPISESVEEAMELVKMAEARKLVFQVGFLERFRYLTLAKKLPPFPGAFYDIQRHSVAPGREVSSNVVHDLMIHDIDLVLSLTREEPSQFITVGFPVSTPYCDFAHVSLEFPGGMVANLIANRVAENSVRKFTIFSSRGHVLFDFISNHVSLDYRDPKRGVIRESMEFPHLDPLHQQCAEFVDNIRRGSVPTVTGLDGLRALKLANLVSSRIEDSSANRESVSVSRSKERRAPLDA